jgi:AAA15 family ATPase/GTPase
MIIEWSVENFLSFSEKQKLSCEANSDSSLRDSNIFIASSKKEEIVKSVAIFGANGSGKSNFINTLKHLQHVAIKGILNGGTEDYYAGSLCHTKNINESLPSKIELVVLIDEITYHYGVSISYWGTIEKEFLTVYLTNKPQKWFSRSVIRVSENEYSGYEYETCVKLKGEKHVWEKATDFTELFLAKASKLGSKQLLPFYEWLCNKLAFLDEHSLSKMATKLRNRGAYKGINELCRFLDLSYSHSDADLIDSFERFSNPLFSKESDTSLKLWDFAFILLDIFEHGRILIVDNFLDKLHPMAVRKVLRLFHNSGINSKNAQLLFTTHMVNLLDQKLLRRDQIWFVDKKYESNPHILYGESTIYEELSELHRLTEFSPRKSDNIERNYLAGEYGALPKPGDIAAVIKALKSA